MDLYLDIILYLLFSLSLAVLEQPLPAFFFLLGIVSKPLLTSFLSLQEVIDLLKRFLVSRLVVSTDVAIRTHVLIADWVLLDSRSSSHRIKDPLSRL